MRLTKPEAITVSICDSETTPIKIKFDNENKNIGLTPELAYSVGLSLINTVETFRAKEAARYEKERKNTLYQIDYNYQPAGAHRTQFFSKVVKGVGSFSRKLRQIRHFGVVTFAGRIGEAN